MANRDDELTLTFNGEIYNYRELRQQLESRGYVFRTSSDTEVLLHAYACWGEECVSHLNGMFAFAIWDEKRNQLFAARDRFGEKPFHFIWEEQQQRFVFCLGVEGPLWHQPRTDSSQRRSLVSIRGAQRAVRGCPDTLERRLSAFYQGTNVSSPGDGLSPSP